MTQTFDLCPSYILMINNVNNSGKIFFLKFYITFLEVLLDVMTGKSCLRSFIYVLVFLLCDV